MEKIINADNIRKFAYVNDNALKSPIKGVMLSFMGLGGQGACYETETVEGEFYGEHGVLYVMPYHNPWSWMNREEVEFVDELLDVLFERHRLPAATPIVSTGESMGGLCCLTYCAYAKRTPVAAVANCPVCNAVFHYGERIDTPRTMYSALHNFDGTLDEGLRSISPLHLATGKLPRIAYHIFHCDKDTAVNKAAHSDKFVAELEKRGYSVTYDEVAGRAHCNLPYEYKVKFANYVLGEISSHN